MRNSKVGYIVKAMSTNQSKCKLRHCFELHYGTQDELCLSCEEEELVVAEFG